MLVDRCVISASDQRIGGQHITVAKLPRHTERVLPLSWRFKIRVQIDDLKVTAVTGCNLLSLLRGYTPAGTTRWCG